MKKIKQAFGGFVGGCFVCLGMLLSVLDWKHGIRANHRPM